MITGLKIATGVTITTTRDTERDMNMKFGGQIPGTQVGLGPKSSYTPSTHIGSTTTIAVPIVFAFQVEKLRVDIRGKVSSKDFIEGAFLARKDAATSSGTVVERAGDGLDGDELYDFCVKAVLGFEDETGLVDFAKPTRPTQPTITHLHKQKNPYNPFGLLRVVTKKWLSV
jgi:hypothetical protein